MIYYVAILEVYVNTAYQTLFKANLCINLVIYTCSVVWHGIANVYWMLRVIGMTSMLI